jgi:hypothetical protein
MKTWFTWFLVNWKLFNISIWSYYYYYYYYYYTILYCKGYSLRFISNQDFFFEEVISNLDVVPYKLQVALLCLATVGRLCETAIENVNPNPINIRPHPIIAARGCLVRSSHGMHGPYTTRERTSRWPSLAERRQFSAAIVSFLHQPRVLGA